VPGNLDCHLKANGFYGKLLWALRKLREKRNPSEYCGDIKGLHVNSEGGISIDSVRGDESLGLPI